MGTKEEIPAGSGVPEKTGQTTENAPAQKSTEQKTDANQSADSKATEETTALKKQLANLEKVIGRQGEELGQLRKEKESMNQQPPTNYDEMEAKIVDQLDNGELDLPTAMRQISKLSSQRGAEEAVSMIEQAQQQNRNQAAIAKFRQDNPDFDSVKESGILDKISRDNPLHDDFSAYLEYKRNELSSMMEQKVAEARQTGEQEGAAIAAESGKAEKVLGGRGNDVRDTNKQTNFSSRSELKSAMAEALSKARGS